MKIDAIDFSSQLQKEAGFELGLGHIKMSRLGRHVVLAGANGAGKSRLLHLIEKVSQNDRKNHHANTEQARLARDRIDWLNSAAGQEFSANFPGGNHPDLAIQEMRRSAAEKCLSLFQAIQTTANVDINLISYRVRLMALGGQDIGPNTVRAQSLQLKQNLGTEHASQLVNSYVKQVLKAPEIASISGRQTPPTAMRDREQRDSLMYILERLLGQECRPYWESEDKVSLFGQSNYEAVFSDGQKVLFQLACTLHAQGTELKDAIIFLDEPENHLHPAALVGVVDSLDALTPNGQLWIATHSVPLIAHLAAKDPACIWYVENGTVEHAGKKPEKVLEGLMGGRAGVQELQDFTLLPGQLALNRFLAECLVPPAVVGADLADPQTTQISSLIQSKRHALNQGSCLRVLDFGAGKGRLLASLAARQSEDGAQDRPLAEWLDYVAFDVTDEHAPVCQAEVRSVYGADETQQRYFTDISKLSSSFDRNSFDLIVMCNVLHEVPPEDWLNLFGEHGKLTRLLKSQGGLLVVEDYQIPAGELAHRHGFLLLDEAELKALFAWKEIDAAQQLFLRETSKEQRYSERLTMHWIGQPLVARTNAASQHAAIKALKEISSERIRRSQSDLETKYNSGHAYALAAQLYANASLWLERHGA